MEKEPPGRAAVKGAAPGQDQEGEAMPVMITVAALAEQMGKDVHTLYEWAARRDDPLPLRYMRGQTRSGAILVSEFDEWWHRNSVQYMERG